MMDADKAEARRLMEAHVTVPEHVVLRRFPAEVVALNLSTGQYHGLNPTAGDILDVLLTGLSVRKAADRIASEYGVDVTQVRADVVSLCSDLGSRGLIEVHGADG